MIGFVESLKVKFTVKVLWKFKSFYLESLRVFHITEADGVWHLYRNMVATKDYKLRSLVFGHMMEEEKHSDDFAMVFKHHSDHPFKQLHFERTELYPVTELWKTLVYVHVGEIDATDRFQMIHDNLPDSDILKKAIIKMVHDEAAHVELAENIMDQIGVTDEQLKKQSRVVRLSRKWEHWLRVGKKLVNHFATLLLTVIYFLIVPFFFIFAKIFLKKHIVGFDNNSIKNMG